jgi:N-acetylmuramic acid 6-phosphate etherase
MARGASWRAIILPVKSRHIRNTTEERNPRSRGLDLKSTREIVSILNREDARVAPAVARQIPQIARAVDAIVSALGRGGRLLYVGAGTSGRLGMLDASECPPTFGVAAGTVDAVIAGGLGALIHAVEGAEDSAEGGARDLAVKKCSAKDVVVGLAASGTTPYVLGALRHAHERGATTVGVTCNPGSPLARLARIVIVTEVGPEAIAGSTRMKAGTSQKLVLNMLSTAAMVRLGYVYNHWMINVAQTNIKLRQRAQSILEQAADATPASARRALESAGGDLRIALIILKKGVSCAEARQRLLDSGGDLRAALGEGRSAAARKRKTDG